MHLIFIALLLRSLATIFAKQAAITSVGHGLYGMIFNVWLLAELMTLGLQAVAWVLVLRRMALSVAYPILSLCFALNLLAAWWIFGETVLPQHIFGVAIIIGGVLILNPTAR